MTTALWDSLGVFCDYRASFRGNDGPLKFSTLCQASVKVTQIYRKYFPLKSAAKWTRYHLPEH